MKKTLISLGVVLLLGAVVIGYQWGSPDNPENSENSVGSVGVLQEYNASTTPYADYWTDRPIKAGYGSLGSVVVTKAGDQSFMLLNATTSLAKSDFTTSSAMLASIPASLAAGTYTFDVKFDKGLYLDLLSGDNGTTTITYR